MVLREVRLDGGVYARVGFAEVQEVGEEAVLEDGHIVVGADVVPVELVVVAEQEEAVSEVMPPVQDGRQVCRRA